MFLCISYSSQASMFRAEALTIEAESDDDDAVPVGKSATPRVAPHDTPSKVASPAPPLKTPLKLPNFSVFEQQDAGRSPAASHQAQQSNRPPSPRWVDPPFHEQLDTLTRYIIYYNSNKPQSCPSEGISLHTLTSCSNCLPTRHLT